MPLRDEARHPETTAERLDQLANLDAENEGVLGKDVKIGADGAEYIVGADDPAFDAAWCRRYVASHPSASATTLSDMARDENDWEIRALAASHPTLPMELVHELAKDHHFEVASVAKRRLGQPRVFPPAKEVIREALFRAVRTANEQRAARLQKEKENRA
jgi:hypothetical protein